MRRLVFITVLAAACGGSQPSSNTPARKPTKKETAPLARGPDGLPIDAHDMDARVESWRTVRRWVLRSSERCLTGAMDLYVPPTDVRWARVLRFRMRAPRQLAFHVDVRKSPRVGSWIGSTMWGSSAEQHAEIMRDQSACVAQTVALAAPSDTTAAPTTTPVATSTKTKTPPTTKGTNVVARSTTTTPPAELDVPVSPETPVRGFVDLGDVPFDAHGDKQTFQVEWVIEPRLAEIPMNDVYRNWVVEDASGLPLYVRVWTQEPQDLEGAIIEIEDAVLEPKIPEAEYARLVERRVGVGKQRQDEFMALCREHPENERCYFTAQNQRKWVGASRPPPPPRDEKQPARPSDDHVWIGGGWQWNGNDYVWIAGMWRYVPPAIIATAAGSTQTTTETSKPREIIASAITSTTTTATPTATATATAAPTAPPPVIMPNAAPPVPPPRTETIPPAPRAGAMWIAGHWNWSGTTWIWITGQWQMPPERTMRWTPPTVQASPGGVQVFMPGGWIRIGR